MPVNPTFINTVPTWHDRVMPNPEDYADDATYQQALTDFVTSINGTDPVFAPPTVNGKPIDVLANPQWKKDLKPGDWRTAGSTNRTVAGQTPGEFYAGALQRIALDDTPGVGGYIGIQRWIANHPDEAQAAYDAVRTDGTAVLPDPVLAMMEQAGLTTTPGVITSPGATNPDDIAANRDKNRQRTGVDDAAKRDVDRSRLRPVAGTTKPAAPDPTRFRPVAGTTRPDPNAQMAMQQMAPVDDPAALLAALIGSGEPLPATPLLQAPSGLLPDPAMQARIRARNGRGVPSRYGY